MDLNNDGVKDLAIGDASGTVYFYPGDGNGAFADNQGLLFDDGTVVKFGGSVNSKPVIFDYNNDGLLDMLTANALLGTTYGRYPINLHLNVGTATEPRFTKSPKSLGMTAIKGCVAMGDLDDDGLPDLVVSQFDYQDKTDVHWYKNTGTLGAPKWGSGQRITFENLPLYDYFHATNEDKVLLDSLVSTGKHWVVVGKRVVNVSIGDYNNDGRNDLLMGFCGFGSSGTIKGTSIPYYETVVNVYYNPTNTVILNKTKISPHQGFRSVTVNGSNLHFNNVGNRDLSFEVYSLRGEKLLSQKIVGSNSNSITVSLAPYSLAQGAYVVRVKEIGFTGKIILKSFQ